jgi:hypothetical protein
VIGTFFVLYVAGYTLNMTLLALSLSIGLLIDDAVVVGEHLQAPERGKAPREAALDGTRRSPSWCWPPPPPWSRSSCWPPSSRAWWSVLPSVRYHGDRGGGAVAVRGLHAGPHVVLRFSKSLTEKHDESFAGSNGVPGFFAGLDANYRGRWAGHAPQAGGGVLALLSLGRDGLR